MDPVSIMRKILDREDSLDIQEAFNIYNLLRARYVSTQTVQFFKNFVHDVDWEILLDKFQSHFEKQITTLEQLGQKFRIILPIRPPLDICFSTRINDIADDYIYKKIYHDLVAQLMSLSNGVRSSSTNDDLRTIIKQDLKTHFDDFDALYKFGKLKGWEETYPVYKANLDSTQEQLSTSEAFHIWDHLTMRYDEIELIGLFSSFIHDSEFKAIMQHGVYVYTKQAKNLEKLALKLNIPLPNMPSLPVTTPIDPETLTDRFMYRTLLNWELASLATHVQALIETIRNDALRKLWTSLLSSELDFYDKFLKYGKMKGWARIVPLYGEPVT